MKTSRTPRVWVLTNTPSPYQLDLFRSVQGTDELEMTVRFLSGNHRGEEPLEESGLRRAEVLPGGVVAAARRVRHELHEAQHDLYVLSGTYSSPVFIHAAWTLQRLGKPHALWLEAPWPTGYRPAWATRWTARYPLLEPVRGALLKNLVRHATMVWGIGTKALEAYQALGAPPERLHLLPYAADTTLFRQGEDPAFRRALGLQGKVAFLFCGSLVARKGVDVLMEAYGRLHRERPDTALVVLGDGLLGSELRAQPGITAPGHLARRELAPYFRAVDAFVFPSRYDGWGVVVQEACAAGLPVITTPHVGAALDLVEDGVNGRLVPRDDVTALAQAMSELAADPAPRMAMGRASREKEKAFDLETGRTRFVEGVNRCLGVAN